MLKKILVYAAGMSSLFAASGRVLLLDDFENAASLRNWKGDIRFRADRASHGRSSAQVRFTERRTDVSLSGMAADWRGDDRLLFEVYNGRKDIFTVTFRIYDDAAAASGARRDYFEAGGQLLLLSGWNDVELKLAGLHAASYQPQLALDRIRRITIAVERRTLPCTLYLDNFRLASGLEPRESASRNQPQPSRFWTAASSRSAR